MKNVWTASRHLSSFVTWTLTPNSCCIYHLFSERSWNIEELEPTAPMMLTGLFASKCFVLSNWWGCETVWWPTYIWQMCFSPCWREEHRGKKSTRENRRGEEKANKRKCEANSQREDLQSQLCQTEDEVKEKQPIKHLATCPFNAGALCSLGAIQGEYVFCLKWLLGRKLKSSEEQLSTDPTYCLLKMY